MTSTIDWARLAASTDAREFAAYSGWFLVGLARLAVGRRSTRPRAPALAQVNTLAAAAAPPHDGDPCFRLICALRRSPGRAQISIGRDPKNDVVIADRTVSRLHAYFREGGAFLELIDPGSRNGTRVNGQPLAAGDAIRLYGGEHLSLGNVDLSFVDGASCWSILRETR